MLGIVMCQQIGQPRRNVQVLETHSLPKLSQKKQFEQTDH